jgi:hypothetical protein
VRLTYVGSGPYCYANSLAMLLADRAPATSAIEVLTGSPFGFQLLHERLPLFDPIGWDPDQGLTNAIDLLGWTCSRTVAADRDDALARLRAATEGSPLLVGPMEIGLLLHQPGSGSPIGSDHYVVVFEAHERSVSFHDPHGHPFATLPTAAFLDAWGSGTIEYAPPWVIRDEFEAVSPVDVREAIERSLPIGLAWLSRESSDANRSRRGGASAAMLRFADQVEAGIDEGIREHLIYFAVRVGARRLGDLTYWLENLGRANAASIAHRQARLVGSLQYGLVSGDRHEVLAGLRALAPTYDHLREALAAGV